MRLFRRLFNKFPLRAQGIASGVIVEFESEFKGRVVSGPRLKTPTITWESCYNKEVWRILK